MSSILLGPPLGGALYTKFGFHGPFILTIIVIAGDLLLRLFIIERKQALRYGVDPAAPSSPPPRPELASPDSVAVPQEILHTHSGEKRGDVQEVNAPTTTAKTKQLSLIGVFKILIKSPRALTVIFNTLIYGYVQLPLA